MGLVGDFFATTVLKYKVEADAAIRDIKSLSKEQQKAAREQADALGAQGKSAEMMGAKYARAAAVVAGAYLAASKGLEALDRQSRLSTGAAGVNIGKLSEAAGGLRTEWQLMEIAQAGSRGAMKLTTQQIGYVIEGMRALEKKGFDATEVQNELTKAMIEGKLEGLDKFGLGLKSTGDAMADSRTLMKALRDEVRDVGGDFDKMGDAAQRSAVTLQNVLKDIQVWLGRATQASLRFAESIGRWAGQKVFGDLPTGTTRDDPAFMARSAQRFALARNRSANAGTILSLDNQLNALGGWDQLASESAKIGAGTTGADRDAARRAEQIYSDLRSGLYNKLGPTALAMEVAKLPEAWEKARPELKRLTDDTFKVLETEWNAKAVMVGKEIAQSLVVGLDDMSRDIKAERARKAGPGPKGDFYSGLLQRGKWFAGNAGAGYVAEDKRLLELAGSSLINPDELTFDQATGLERRASMGKADSERISAAFEQAKVLNADFLRLREEGFDRARESYLARMFGPIDEFDLYTQALTDLSDVTQSVTAGIYSTWANGGELTAKAVRKMIAASIAAEGQQLLATGIRYTLTGIGTAILEPGTGGRMIAAGAGMIAGAATIGGIARALGGGGAESSSSSSYGSSGAAARARNQDHRGERGGTITSAGSSQVIIVGGVSDFDSDRYRAERLRDAMRRSSAYPRPTGTGAM